MHATPKQRSIIELRGGTFPALFMIPGGARSALSSTKFSRLIEAPGRVYGLEYPGMGGYLEPLERIESLASFFITEIRSVQPSGPYYLGGFCLGGVIAFEIAHQLKAQGQEIGLVSLLDSSPPGMKDDELDNPGRWYYFERLKTLFNAENRRNAPSFIRSRLRRIRLFGNGHRSSQSPPRRRSRIKLSDGIKTPLDEQSLQVIAGLQKARKNYRPELLEAQGLVVLSSMAKGTPREVWWSRLFTVFNCHYIPNTIHNNIFSDASLLQLARLVSLAIQQDQSRRLV
jgi:hypothetical protein